MYIWRKLGHKRNVEENMFLRLCRIAADNHCLDHYICLLRTHWMEGEACNRFFSLSLFIACIDKNHFPLDILFTLKNGKNIWLVLVVFRNKLKVRNPNLNQITEILKQSQSLHEIKINTNTIFYPPEATSKSCIK